MRFEKVAVGKFFPKREHGQDEECVKRPFAEIFGEIFERLEKMMMLKKTKCVWWGDKVVFVEETELDQPFVFLAEPMGQRE